MVEQYQWYSLLSITTSALALGLALFVYRRHPGRRESRTFVAAMTCFLLAAFAAYEIKYGFAEREGGAALVWSARSFYFVHMLAVGLTAAFVGTYFHGFAVFRRKGVGTFLYFSLGAAAVFVAALVGETTIPYFEGQIPSSRNATLALATISTGYGLLMVGSIARTLQRNRDPVVRKQATVMLAGILLHGATAETYAYFRITAPAQPIVPFLTASALFMASAFTIAILRYRMFVVTPKGEEAVPLPRKFVLKPGRAYLVREKKPDLAFRALSEAAHRGEKALVVSRQTPAAVREEFDLEQAPILWLTSTAGQNCVPPTHLETLEQLVTSFVAQADHPVVGIEGIEYLSSYHEFERVLRCLHRMHDLVAAKDGVVLASVNASLLDDREISLLAQEFEPFPALAASPAVEDVFLIHYSGLLIHHAARRLKPETDRDTMAGMLTAIMNFAKVSFSEGSGELRRLELGEKTIVLERGRKLILAVVFAGAAAGQIDGEMRAFLWRAERKFAACLDSWSGNLEEVSDLSAMTDRMVTRLLV